MAVWTKHYKDGTAYPSITGGGGASPQNVSTTSALVSAPSNAVVQWTGGNITTGLTLTSKSNLTIRGLRFTGNGNLTLTGPTNVRVEDCEARTERSDGGALIFVRGAYNRVQIDDSIFGPDSAGAGGGSNTRFVMFGDSASQGSQFGLVTRCTFQNKNRGGNCVHTAGNTENTAGQGGVRYTLVSQCYYYKTAPFDTNDHESMLMGLSNMQLTDGQTVIEWCLFEECASEPEVISNKQNNGIIRGCTFLNCVGSASLRHGDFGRINDCHFYGDAAATDPSSGATRVSAGTRSYGRGHEIDHNTIRVRGNANYERPILIDTGDVAPGTTSNGHANNVSINVHDNLLVDCRAPIVVGDNYSTAPTGQIRDNMVVQCDNAGTTGILIINNTSMSGMSTGGNQVFATTGAASLTQGASGEWRHTTKGARTVFLTTSMVGKDTTFDPYIDGWIEGGGSTPPPPPDDVTPTPGEVLHIGKTIPGWNRMNWGLGLTEHVDHTLDEITNGYEDEPWFYVKKNLEGKWVVESSAPLNGARTSPNTNYPRSEGRELIYNADGTSNGANRAFWQPTGENYIAGFYRIVGITTAKSEVVVQQIHDGDDDQMMCRLQENGDLRFLVRGSTVVTNLNGTAYVPSGTAPEFFIMQGIFDGQPKVWFRKPGDSGFPTTSADIHALRLTTPTYSGSASEFDTAFLTGFYTKSGAYLQSNTTTDPNDNPSAAITKVQMRGLVIWHTGQPAPAEYETTAAPIVSAGADQTITLGETVTRTAVEENNGSAITSRAWKIFSGPVGAGSTLGTSAALSWVPTMAGVYSISFEAANALGTSPLDFATITVQAVGGGGPTTPVDPSFVSIGTPYNGEGTTVVVPPPPGVTPDMIQFCVIQDAGDEEMVGIPPDWFLTPGGTVLVQSATGDPGGPSRSWLYYNENGDTATRTWTKNGSRFTHAVRFCYRDYEALGTVLAIQSPSGLQHTLPEVSPQSANATVIGIIVADLLNASAGPVTPPTGWTERFDQTASLGTENETIAIADVKKSDLEG
jgi:hypothetical protein